MWMRGYNNNLTSSSGSSPVNNGSGGGATDHGQFGNTISPADSFNGARRLRPLIPKPSSIPIPPTCFNHGNCDTTNFFPLNHPMATSHHHYMGVGEQCRRDQVVNGHQAVVVSSRWNPTPDQLRALEELYRRGTRTPSADQIQHITAQLRRYGKIEGKNVFYWFQNHKARERQKRRRQQLDNSASPNDHQQSQDHQDQQQKKDPEGDESNHDGNKGSTTGFEIEQTKLWAAPTNCSTLADQVVSEHNKPEKAAVECVADDPEWVQFQDQRHNYSSATILRDTAEEHRRRRTSLNLITKNNANWNNIHLSLPTDPPSSIISFTKSNVMNETSMVNEGDADQCDNNERALTLELFPLRSNNGTMDLMKDDDGDEKGTHLTSYQFFEFLPLKNSTAY